MLRIWLILTATLAVLFVINFTTFGITSCTKQSKRVIFGFRLASALTGAFTVLFAFISFVLLLRGA